MQELVISESSSFGEALTLLPQQYVRVLCQPSVKTLADVKKQAHWGVALLQLQLLLAVTITFSILGQRMASSMLHISAQYNLGSFRPLGFLPAPFTGMTLIGASFFIGLLTAYLFSKGYRGKGSFLEHMNTLLVSTIPLVTISGLLLLLPAHDGLGTLAVIGVLVLFAYRMILHALTIMAVHGFSGTRATGIVLIIPAALLLLVLLIFFIILAIAGDGDGGGDWFALPGLGNSASVGGGEGGGDLSALPDSGNSVSVGAGVDLSALSDLGNSASLGKNGSSKREKDAETDDPSQVVVEEQAEIEQG